MKEDSNVKMVALKATQGEEGSCGGAMEQKKRKYRRLRSKSTNKIIHQKKERPRVPKVFDPTAWYVVQTKRNTECESVNILNGLNMDYSVKAYAAIQNGPKPKLVIRNKIFVCVDEAYRIQVLRLCPYLKGYVKDPARELTQHDFTDFARVPDREIVALQEILKIAEGDVEYEATMLPKDTVSFRHGILAESEELRDLKGEIQIINGRKRATVILDKIGVFKFTLPVSDLKKV